MREPAVYMMAIRRNGTLYTGVTADLSRCVWIERYKPMTDAIAREKQIKDGSRGRKLALIKAMNPQWRDLCNELAR